MTTPYSGLMTAQFYCVETEPGVTPDNPVWTPLRNTGGIPNVMRDSIVSAELDGTVEITDVRLSNIRVEGEYAVELSQSSQDDLIANAIQSTFVAGGTLAGLTITVDADAKTFTSDAGDFTSSISAGDLICYPGLTGDNAKAFIATSVTPLVITGGSITHTLTDETDVTTDLTWADTISNGNECKTMSILTWMRGKCGTADKYLVSRGVEFSSFSLEAGVNAMVTGSFPFIGRSQSMPLDAAPAGSTYNLANGTRPYSSVDVVLANNGEIMKLIDSFTASNDNAASAQYELGNNDVAFIERDKATNTISGSGKVYDFVSDAAYLAEEKQEMVLLMSGADGAMSITMRNVVLTENSKDIGGATSITRSLSGQATGGVNNPSMVIQRLTYA